MVEGNRTPRNTLKSLQHDLARPRPQYPHRRAGQQCAWLKDKFGLSWQIVPTILPTLLGDPDRARANRVMLAMLQMKKIGIAKLQQAYAG